MTRTWNGRVRPIAGLAATTLTILTLFSGAGPALALQTTASGSDTTTTADHSGSSDHSDGNAGTAGSSDEPQPESTADQNSGGANGECPDGPYCSTRDGSASENGAGDGAATGEPCAGCVGKADNKNPKGQYPGGSDDNAGYECDSNQGVGQGNPAHTGCQQTTSSVAGSEQSCSTDDSTTTDESTSEEDSSSSDESTSEEDSKSTDESTSEEDSKSTDGSMSGDDCPPCPTEASMSDSDQACDGAAAPRLGGTTGTTVTTTSAGRPAAVLGVEAFRAPVQAKDGRSAVVAAAAAVLPDALLPNTGAGAAMMLLLLAGVAMLLVGTFVLVVRRRKVRI